MESRRFLLGEQSYIATDADGVQLGAGEYGVGDPLCFEAGDTDVECPAAAIADLTFVDADGDGIVGSYDPWTGRFTVEVANIGTANSNYFYTMAHSAYPCLLYTSPSPRDMRRSRMPSSA